ncbi:MAG: hypothetical protein U1A77_06140 [Pirellulales bacterium]
MHGFRKRISGLLAGLALVCCWGCGGTVKEEQIQVKTATDPLANAKTALQRYADGQPLGSEVTMFDFMVEELKKVDPAKADILKEGLDGIKATPAQAATKAKETLGKL